MMSISTLLRSAKCEFPEVSILHRIDITLVQTTHRAAPSHKGLEKCFVLFCYRASCRSLRSSRSLALLAWLLGIVRIGPGFSVVSWVVRVLEVIKAELRLPIFFAHTVGLSNLRFRSPECPLTLTDFSTGICRSKSHHLRLHNYD